MRAAGLAAAWAALLVSPVWAQHKRPPSRPAAVEPSPTPTPLPIQRSTSASRQFVIYHPDGTVRSKVARKAEDLKAEWLRMLRLTDDWKAPLIVQIATLAPPGSPRLKTGLYVADAGEFKVQIDVFDPTAFRGADFEREVYRALCLELMHRKTPPKAGKPYQQPPTWLLEAFTEESQARAGEGIGAGLYEKILESGAPVKLEAFLKERPEMMDATTRAIYRARSRALLRALLGLPDGPPGMVAWIRSLSTGNPTDAGRLMAHFPSLANDPTNLSKQWTLALADASASDRVKLLTMAETVRQLAQIMDFGAPTDPKKPNEALVSGPMALPLIARTKAGPFIVRRKAEELLRLQMRAHPLIRPLIEEYQLIATELALKPKKNVEKRLEKNLELQKAVTARAAEIEDYMNWFEAAKLEVPSREFDVLLEMPQPEGRNDPITRYMNDLEARGW
jgi:hypothetical protein